MKALAFLSLVALSLSACTPAQRDISAREWQRGQCNQVLDTADRERCLKRVEETYGSDMRPRMDPPVRN